MRARSFRLAALSTFVALVGATVPGAASAAETEEPLPVPYTFPAPAVLAGLRLGTDAPGTNDWTCKPTAAHPDPVVLVHGTFGNKSTNWQTFGPLLANEGYCVFALTYGTSPQVSPAYREAFGGLTEIESSAAELKDFVARVLDSTGAAQVDILGHSQGTLMPNYYAKFLGGAPYIDDYVSLASLWHGTNPAGLASLNAQGRRYGFPTPQFEFFPAGAQMLAGSEFIQNMRSGGTPAVPGITYTNIVTKFDELVIPYKSGIEPGMTNFVVQDVCRLDLADHLAIAADPIAAQLVLNALDPANAERPRCRPVLPVLGSLR
jgi:triacylglycerol lipase